MTDLKYLKELQEKSWQIKSTKGLLSEAYSKREALEKRIKSLLEKSEKERQEADDFADGNFRSFISRILGTRDSELKREISEAESAENAYNFALTELSELNGYITKTKPSPMNHSISTTEK